MSKSKCYRKGGKRTSISSKGTKLWKQHGCSTTRKMGGRSGVKRVFKTSKGTRKGGSCGTCGLMKGGCGSCGVMRGGRGLPPVPKPLVGKPWSSNISDWPGASGQQGVTNYFKNNTYSPVDISRTMKSTAATNDMTNWSLRGLSNAIAGNVQKGGAFSSDLSSLGQSLKYGLGNGINAFVGKPQSVNNLPYKGQFPNNLTNQQLRNVM